jgi:hypothetical protein
MRTPRRNPPDSNSRLLWNHRRRKTRTQPLLSVNVIPDYCTSRDARCKPAFTSPQHAVRSRLCGADHSGTSETLLANLSARMDGFRSAKTGLGRGIPGGSRGRTRWGAPKIRDGHARRMGNA